MEKDAELTQLRELLSGFLTQSIPMTVLTDPNKKTYAPEEVSKIVLDSYLMGFSDVVRFIDGDTIAFEEIATVNGRVVVVDTRQKRFVFPVPKEDVPIGENQRMGT